MVRKIVEIDEEKCTGCGLCAKACHESAIEMSGGKARLVKDDYCDGLGDCLPACPADAIRIIEREASAYDEAAVLSRKKAAASESVPAANERAGRLCTWPVQIQLAPIKAEYFQGADLVIASDCTAYAYADLHRDFLRGRVVLIGCPKLDSVDYSQKITKILRENEIRSVQVIRMEVPCCGGMEYTVKQAVADSGKALPCEVITISLAGEVMA